MRLRHPLALLIVLFLHAAILQSQQNATIQGRVNQIGSSDPVARASLELKDADVPTAPLYTTTSDQDGKFSFRNIPASRYQLTATRNGFVTAAFGQRALLGPAEVINVVAGQSLTALQITMTPAAVISGRIYDKTGQPFANVAVSADRISFQGGTKSMQLVRGAVTNDLGEYRIFGLPPGLYYVTAVQRLAVYPQFGYGGIQTVETYARLRTEQEPQPANSPNAISVTYPDKTNPFEGVPIDLRPGADIRNVNMIVGEMQHTTRLTGTFVSPESGQPVKLMSATLVALNGGLNRVLGIGSDGFIPNPIFNLGFIPPGPYMISGTGPQMAGRYFFDVKNEESIELSVKLQKGFDVPGKVTVEGGGLANANIPAFQVELRLDIPINTPGGSVTAAPKTEGSFSFEGVLPGTYFIGLPALQYQRTAQPPRLQPALQNAYVKSIKLGSEDALNGKLFLDEPPRQPIEIVIGMNAASLDGKVTAPSGMDLNGITVVLIPENRSRPDTFKSATTDKDGKFLFERIPPGNYKVFAWEFVEINAWRVPEFLATDESRGVSMQFAEGERKTVEVPMIPAR